jgi:hypothetical protein
MALCREIVREVNKFELTIQQVYDKLVICRLSILLKPQNIEHSLKRI